MTREFADRDELLRRYELVGGPEDMVPRLERVAKACASSPTLMQWAQIQAEALFEAVPAVNIKNRRVPELELGDDVGAFNMMVALASVPLVAKTHNRFGFTPDHLAHTFSWFRPIIEIYRRRHKGASGITHTRTFWFRKHVDGELFRFGSMEFLRGPVPSYVPDDFKRTLGPEDEVPTFHYPGGPNGLDPGAIKAAFAEANAFWLKAFGHFPRAWACDSWLFNPAWRELIPNSRIAHAIDLFDELPPLAYNPDEPSGLFFVYGKERCDPRDFPVVNSLEKAFVAIYDRGQRPRDGCAWVKVDENGRVCFRS